MKGIKSAAGVQILGGSFTIDAADDALHSDVSMTICGGSFQIASGDDALHAEDTLTISAGTLDISHCYEGLEALHVVFSGGEATLAATDDGVNAAGGMDQSGAGGRDQMFGGRGGMSGSSGGSITISGGVLTIQADGDGLDANGTIEITGGTTTVAGPTQGDTATLDYDTTATISGGVFIGTGARNMAQTFSDPQQGTLAVRVGSQSAGTQVLIADGDQELICFTPSMDFQVVIVSMPELVSGKRYTLTVGSQSAQIEAM